MDQENNCNYISSRGILKSCDIQSATPVSGINTLINYNFYNISYNSIIYICIGALKYFIINILPHLPCKIILVTGDNDETCPDDVFKTNDEFLNFIESDNITHWFAQNCVAKHPKITQIPIGLDYHTMAAQNHHWGPQTSPIEQEKILLDVKNSSKPFWEREIKAHSNFHFFMGTKYGYDRIDAKNNLPEELIYYEPKQNPRLETWINQSKYAYVISPLGNGMDCHRTWEALCLGCIPIVKTSDLDQLYEDLPVLIVKEWSNVSKELLEQTIEEFKNKNFNYDKLTLKYWINLINSYKNI
jgi:hypothetical protein